MIALVLALLAVALGIGSIVAVVAALIALASIHSS